MPLKFLNSYFPQSFALLDAVIYNITQQPSNPKGYQKLIQCCKYFFTKNPILIFHCLRYMGDQWETCLDGKKCIKGKKINFNFKLAKLWILDTLTIQPYSSNFLVSSIISRLFKHDMLGIKLEKQRISVDELLLFSSKFLFLSKTTVVSKNGPINSLPKIFENFLDLEIFFYECSNDNFSIITRNTVKELLEIPHFHTGMYFILKNVPDSFDLETFYEFFKENDNIQFHLVFSYTISEEYKNRLEEIVDEILENECPNYIVPFIEFPEMDFEKEKKILARTLHKTYA